MAKSNLDWLFSPAGELASAQKLFADRLPQQEAFNVSVEALRKMNKQIICKNLDVQEILNPRKNILHFYGIGGIGKTEILDRLYSSAKGLDDKTQHWTKYKYAEDTISCFYDLARHCNPTPENLLLAIRQNLATRKIKCPAFDLLIVRYWALNNPNESLEGYLSKRSQFSSIDDKTGLSEQIETSLGEAASLLLGITSGISGSTILKLVKTVGGAIAKAGLKKTTLQNCKRLEEMLKSPATIEVVPFYASALAWDLSKSRLNKDRVPLVIVFLDHLEEMDPRLELMIQQIVWLLPNVLFVSSGRNQIRWANNNATGLFRNGPDNWPLLVKGVTEEPRQHRIGALSSKDTNDFLTNALVGHSFNETELNKITETSGGFPYHLDLMVQHWAELKTKGNPDISDLLIPFPDLARRVLKDLDYMERRALFACTLFDQFDSELIAKTAGIDDGIVKSLLKKPLFKLSQPQYLPLSLDRSLRKIFLNLAEEGFENWSRNDWRSMAQEAVKQIKNRFYETNSFEKRFWLAQIIQVCHRFGLTNEWIVEAAMAAVDGADWDPNWRIEELAGCPESMQIDWMTDFALSLKIIFSRQSQSRNDVVESLTRIILQYDGDERFDLVRYFNAQANRDIGNLIEADKIFQELIDNKSILEGRARHGSIQLLRRQGKISQALEEVYKGRLLLPAPYRIQAEIEWTQGLFERSAENFGIARQNAIDKGQIGEAWSCAVYHAFAFAWGTPSAALLIFENHKDARPEFTASWEDGIEKIIKTLTTEDNSKNLHANWKAGRNEAKELKQTSLVCYHDLAAIFCFEVRSEKVFLNEALDALKHSSKDASISYLLDISGFITNQKKPSSPTEWIDNNVKNRWIAALNKRRNDWALSINAE